MKAILDRFEGSSAILRIEGGQELVMPKEELPKEAKEGAALFLMISQSASEEEAREKLAKSILNEILNTEV
ncbi:hypothetical protein A3B21_04785 [Candidatus Uhrbacteria bacterium RIFCSPLOWO2_01_FULL_47_24]|uniref:DUF3006 domain-containing protein n=1 Tax=Candidatus Uhrbacteria bacterium RIFCSPLOWO2_01_FULL_47_24 TaxID=1802401 RepID=A0A1F7UUS3_9BACT|nr:MAG: hypothetical protein A2753_00405 [Candidatus Uhrbacteria bacterium RIFCSPHIGHO2_01_FULL_47_11]OGL69269.1 MAG: hypothetical protein A3D58_03170 [Candidatus Uhrbacteria bacterium RIFCSPHIGHO2_02_FULL_46_47]OGL76913.1 MAG: hypothetical protein A3F52_00515 [Candidatus Uhrbacteria bacterium RIFCSPHIGHO2_12_FULL_47_11]OGL82005.1 MAG: hypothetical protein A3B21_04785 [Candidatus Uhrbacteria bacterium RIFCSPLOWO2_01_FULL_47_24]OGL85399.1 MAG: hypothetical protein A3J03_04950 [Candidatus Uhrbact